MWRKFHHPALCLCGEKKQCECECTVFVRWTQPSFVHLWRKFHHPALCLCGEKRQCECECECSSRLAGRWTQPNLVFWWQGKRAVLTEPRIEKNTETAGKPSRFPIDQSVEKKQSLLDNMRCQSDSNFMRTASLADNAHISRDFLPSF